MPNEAAAVANLSNDVMHVPYIRTSTQVRPRNPGHRSSPVFSSMPVNDKNKRMERWDTFPTLLVVSNKLDSSPYTLARYNILFRHTLPLKGTEYCCSVD